jgi:hypothetical protein
MPEKQFGRRRSLPDTKEAEFKKGASEGSAVAPAVTDTSGWGGMDKAAAGVGGDLYLKVEEKDTVIKILDSEPFDNYVSHWVDEVEDGSKSIRCWANADCPLCSIGDKPKKFAACFNVVSLADPKLPVLRVWEAGVKIARLLKEIALDEKKGPLNRADLYFSVKKVQKNKSVEYVLERIRARDLEEEYAMPPLSEEVILGFQVDAYKEPVKDTLDAADMGDIVKILLDD